jgi:hypothetical protein
MMRTSFLWDVLRRSGRGGGAGMKLDRLQAVSEIIN